MRVQPLVSSLPSHVRPLLHVATHIDDTQVVGWRSSVASVARRVASTAQGQSLSAQPHHKAPRRDQALPRKKKAARPTLDERTGVPRCIVKSA